MKLLAEMFTLAPANKDHHVAVRCAVGVFVPLITLVLLGRLDLAIFASFGAFTGIYGRGELHRKRFFIQIRAGGLMLLVILLASLTARIVHAGGLAQEVSIWLQVLATTLVAGGCSLVIARWRHRPAGSLFHIFAFAAIASMWNSEPADRCRQRAITSEQPPATSVVASTCSQMLTSWARPPACTIRLVSEARRITRSMSPPARIWIKNRLRCSSPRPELPVNARRKQRSPGPGGPAAPG